MSEVLFWPGLSYVVALALVTGACLWLRRQEQRDERTTRQEIEKRHALERIYEGSHR